MSGGGHDRSEAGEPGSGNGDRRGGEERGQRWKGRLSGDPQARKGKEETSGVLRGCGEPSSLSRGDRACLYLIPTVVL
jgi:hypothetical protein